MTDASTPHDPPSEPVRQPSRGSRVKRALGLVAVTALGCSVHALLFALVHSGMEPLLGPLGMGGALPALLTSALLVVGLAALAPGLPWWGLAMKASQSGESTRGRWVDVTLQLGRQSAEDRTTRRGALRAALALHGGFALPALSVTLALTVGGVAWALPALVMLLSPALVLGVGRMVRRGFVARAITVQPGSSTPRGAPRALVGLVLTSGALMVGVGLSVSVPAPTSLAGTCDDASRGTPTSLPGALPETRLFAEASAQAITLSAADGGGPGSIPLSSCTAFACSTVPVRVVMQRREEALEVTLCPAVDARGPAQRLLLAPEGYRLDDGIARRVLRSPTSVVLALVLVLLAFAYSRWGFAALLRWSSEPDASPPSPHARVAVLWALALCGVQLAWLLVTWLGP